MSPSKPTMASRTVDIGAPLALVAAILVCWELAVHLLAIPADVLPAPSAILASLARDGGVIFPHMGVTLFEILTGYVLACTVGFLLSILIVYSNAFRRGVLPLIVASQTIPVIAIAPVLVIWFGYNYIPRILITALVAFFPLTISFVTGMQALERESINFFKSLNATPLQIFFKLRLPTALPNIFAGLKVASTLAVIGATISEWVGASEGLGYLMAQDSAQLNTTRVFAALMVLGLCGMGFFASVSLIERISMPWVYGRVGPRWLFWKWPGKSDYQDRSDKTAEAG